MTNHGRRDIAALGTSDETAIVSPLRAQLDHYVEQLNSNPYIRAYLREPPISFPFRLDLITSPKYVRNQDSIMINFVVYPTYILVLGSKEKLNTPARVEQFMDNFVFTSEFPHTVKRYREVIEAPATGFLKTGKVNEISIGDVVLEVSPEENKRIATLALEGRDDTVMLDATLVEPSSDRLSPFRQDGRYAYLTFAGHIAAVHHCIQRGANIAIACKVFPERPPL